MECSSLRRGSEDLPFPPEPAPDPGRDEDPFEGRGAPDGLPPIGRGPRGLRSPITPRPDAGGGRGGKSGGAPVGPAGRRPPGAGAPPLGAWDPTAGPDLAPSQELAIDELRPGGILSDDFGTVCGGCHRFIISKSASSLLTPSTGLGPGPRGAGEWSYRRGTSKDVRIPIIWVIVALLDLGVSHPLC